MMLVLSRRRGESIVINNEVTISVVDIRGDKVRLGVESPKDVPVYRREIYEAIQRHQTPVTVFWSATCEEEEAFIREIRERDDDESRYAVYADWLEERGDSKAEYVRICSKLRKLHWNHPERRTLQQRLNELRPLTRSAPSTSEHAPLDPRRQDGRTTEQLLQMALRDGDALRACRAAKQLADRSLTARDFQVMSEAVAAADAELRMRTIAVLGHLQLHAGPARALVEKALRDPIWTVREAVATALAQLASAEEVDASEVHAAKVGLALHDSSQFVRDAACQSLVQLAQRQNVTLAALRQALGDKRPPVRCRAVEALVCFPDRAGEFWAELLMLLDDAHFRVRRRAILAMPLLGPRSVTAIPALIRRCCERDPNVRRAALESLEKTLTFAPPPLRDALAPLLVGEGDAELILRHALQEWSLSPTVRNEFAQVCRRRCTWWLNRTDRNVEPVIMSEVNVDAVMDAAHIAKGRCSSEQESAWLLAKLVKLWLGE